MSFIASGTVYVALHSLLYALGSRPLNSDLMNLECCTTITKKRHRQVGDSSKHPLEKSKMERHNGVGILLRVFMEGLCCTLFRVGMVLGT